jgi:HAD superfamily hydrolase (TIGR01509 family)
MMKVMVFDLGGVLIKISRSWEEAAERAGVDLQAGHVTSGSLVRPRGNQSDLQKGLLDFDTFLERESSRLGGAYSEEALANIHQQWLLGEYEGVADIIERLRAARIRTATLSNTDAEHWKTLAELPAIAGLDEHVLSFRLGMLKPADEMYHAAEEILDATGSSICYLDDLRENVEAALRCGWNAIQVDPMEPTAPQIEQALVSFGIEC